MSWTKRQLVTQAFEEIGYAEYAFDLAPEQLVSGLRRLEAMMGTWNGRGIRLGYPLSSSPDDAELDVDSNIPDSATEAVYTNLAIRIAPILGKAVSNDTAKTARSSYNELISRFATPQEQQLPGTMPAGAGNKPWRQTNPFLPGVKPSLDAGGDGPIEFD
jgi:hypothetical protein